MDRNYTLPSDIDAEKAVLGSDDFYLKEHQEIYKAMLEDQEDITTVYSLLKLLREA